MPKAYKRSSKIFLSAIIVVFLSAGCSTTGRNSQSEIPSPSRTGVTKSVGEEINIGDRKPFQEVAGLTSLSLSQARALAISHNPLIRKAQGGTNVSAARRIQAGLWSNPELELFAEEVPFNSGGLSRSKNMIGVSQVVPFPGKKSLDRELGDIGVKQSEYEYKSVVLRVLRDVEVAYYRVLGAEQRKAIANELKRVAQSLSETAQKRFDAGESAAQENVRAQIEYERALTKVYDTEQKLVEARQTLTTAIGAPEVEPLPLSGKFPEAVDRDILDYSEAVMLKKHPRLSAAVAATERARVAVKRSKRQRYPDVTMGIAGGREEIEGQELLEFRLSFPLPFLDRGQGRILQAIAQSDIAEARLTSVEQELLREFNALTAKYGASINKVVAYQEIILPKTTEALRMVSRGFEEGKFGFIDVLDTQRTAAESRLDYQSALLELNESRAQLEALIGE